MPCVWQACSQDYNKSLEKLQDFFFKTKTKTKFQDQDQDQDFMLLGRGSGREGEKGKERGKETGRGREGRKQACSPSLHLGNMNITALLPANFNIVHNTTLTGRPVNCSLSV